MAAFIGFTSWSGEFDDAYLDEPAPDAAALGLPAADDGTRDDPLLSGATSPIIEFRPDTAALRTVSTRVVVAVGEESGETFTGRTTRHLARLLGQDAAVFPSHHDGFVEGGGRPGQPEAFAVRLREVLAGD
jgi:hypothetical protein